MSQFIYHYTSSSALVEILKHGELWASHLRYSNDATESTYGREEVLARLGPKTPRLSDGEALEGGLDGSGKDDASARWAGHLTEVVRRVRDSQAIFGPFGVCFTKLEDSLSQWRGYGNYGCAIGVDPPDAEGKLALAPDFYAESEQITRALDMRYGPKGMETVLENITSYGQLRQEPQSVLIDDPSFAEDHMYAAIEELATLKDPGFAEEEEVRLLSTPRGTGGLYSWRADYRTSPSGLIIPYQVFKINRAAIREIWIGPGPHQVENYEAIKFWIHNFPVYNRARSLRDGEHFDNLVIRCSGTPFR